MKIKDTIFIIIIAAAAIVVGLFISPFASSFPDGLEKVAENLGFIDKAADLVNFKFIIPDYSFEAVKSTFWQTSLAGLFGVLIIFAVFALIYAIVFTINKGKKFKNNS